MKHQLFIVIVSAASLFVLSALAADPSGSLEGTWSAPSLSRREVPIIVTILPGGKAFEQIATYHGEGTWKPEGNSVRIFWASEWIGLLRPTAEGAYELLTWKKGTPPDGPPDDIQPAKRVTPP